jgi:hypothetical protein
MLITARAIPLKLTEARNQCAEMQFRPQTAGDPRARLQTQAGSGRELPVDCLPQVRILRVRLYRKCLSGGNSKKHRRSCGAANIDIPAFILPIQISYCTAPIMTTPLSRSWPSGLPSMLPAWLQPGYALPGPRATHRNARAGSTYLYGPGFARPQAYALHPRQTHRYVPAGDAPRSHRIATRPARISGCAPVD